MSGMRLCPWKRRYSRHELRCRSTWRQTGRVCGLAESGSVSVPALAYGSARIPLFKRARMFLGVAGSRLAGDGYRMRLASEGETQAMKVKKQSNKVSALTPEELARVLKIAAENSPRDHAMMLAQYFHGLGASELVKLKLTKPRDRELKPGDGFLDRRQKVWFLT